MKIPELLAPAGSWDALAAAVAAGADAVYLGGKKFSARMFAENFPRIEDVIDYAHARDVRVYVTVNTLVHDGELAEVEDYLRTLYEIGADAILVQDIGVAALARALVPELELHASTQMTIHNKDGVLWAARNGFRRVVLARELSLDEIKNIKTSSHDLGIGLEIFIHGALCYSYSGQCLLSSFMGGRSGNRGMCAQPCRKQYVLLGGKTDEYGRPRDLRRIGRKEYLLSTKDLCTYPYLDEIVSAGVDALKIEGRMKSAEYVAIVTKIYRDALDSIERGEWRPDERDVQELALAFNRGFTAGYILGATSVMGREMPDNRGVLIGTVLDYSDGIASVSASSTSYAEGLLPERGDGIVIRSGSNEIGFVVRERVRLENGTFKLRAPAGTKAGMDVYITRSSRLKKKAEMIMSEGRSPIPIDLRIEMNDVPLAHAILDSRSGHMEFSVRAGFRMEPARTLPLTPSQIESHMRRTGGTQFVFRTIEIDYPGGLYTTPANLNQFRRDIISAAEKTLKAAYKRSRISGELPDLERSRRRSGALSLSVYVNSIDALRGALDGKAKRIYFEPQVERIALLLEDAHEMCMDRAELVWKWPRITRDRFLAKACDILAEIGPRKVMVENLGAFEAARRSGCEIFGGAGLNVWNSLAVRELSELKVVTLSPELSEEHISTISDLSRRPELELMVQGNSVIALTEDHLPNKDFVALQDQGRIFPVYHDGEATNILNCVETCLLDYIPRIISIGIDSIAIDARWKTEMYAEEMCDIYNKAINGSDIEELKKRIRQIASGGITAGHFLRGVALAEDMK